MTEEEKKEASVSETTEGGESGGSESAETVNGEAAVELEGVDVAAAETEAESAEATGGATAQTEEPQGALEEAQAATEAGTESPEQAEATSETPAAESGAVAQTEKLQTPAGETPAAESVEGAPVDAEREAKLKAAAEARAARAAAKAAAEGGEGAAAPPVDAEREAKLKAAAEARAARAAAKAAAEGGRPTEEKPPSARLPELERLAQLIRQGVAEGAVKEAYINALSGDMPTIVLEAAHWPAAARLLKEHEELGYSYLRNVSGVDYESHLEVVYHLLSLGSKRDAAIKIRTEREQASVPSAAPVWSTANWNEREIFDLLGIDFPGHPDMRRIMMPDDWAGHPLRKDYEPLDPEV